MFAAGNVVRRRQIGGTIGSVKVVGIGDAIQIGIRVCSVDVVCSIGSKGARAWMLQTQRHSLGAVGMIEFGAAAGINAVVKVF